jgi:hypothetical protein
MNTSLEKAVRYISDTLTENPDDNIIALIERASRMFNLTPVEEDHLMRIHTDSDKKK